MGCTHCEHCELYAQFALNPAMQLWQAHYCQGDYNRCVRFQMSLRKETVPLNMLPNGARVEIPRSANDFSATALFNAILKSRTYMVESLLKNGIDVNVRNSDGMTPLMAAANVGNIEIIRMLLARGADMTVVNSLGERACDIAERAGHAEAANVLRAIANKVATKPTASGGGWLSRLRRQP